MSDAEPVFRCPTCSTEFLAVPAVQGPMWRCATCSGHFVSGQVIVRIASHELVAKIWDAAMNDGRPGSRACPRCEVPMRTFSTGPDEGSLPLDGCEKCHSLWFDAGEFQAVPGLNTESIRPPTEDEVEHLRTADRKMLPPEEAKPLVTFLSLIFAVIRSAGDD